MFWLTWVCRYKHNCKFSQRLIKNTWFCCHKLAGKNTRFSAKMVFLEINRNIYALVIMCYFIFLYDTQPISLSLLGLCDCGLIRFFERGLATQANNHRNVIRLGCCWFLTVVTWAFFQQSSPTSNQWEEHSKKHRYILKIFQQFQLSAIVSN